MCVFVCVFVCLCVCVYVCVCVCVYVCTGITSYIHPASCGKRPKLTRFHPLFCVVGKNEIGFSQSPIHALIGVTRYELTFHRQKTLDEEE